MDKPGAKQGDSVVGVDTHILMIPSPAGPVPTPTPLPFNGSLVGELSEDVLIEDMPAAVEGSVARNLPPHVPAGGPFQKPPANEGKVMMGSGKVLINDKKAARIGEQVKTCADPADAPNGTIVGSGTVLMGG